MSQRRHNNLLHRSKISLTTATGRQWHIDVKSFAIALSLLRQLAHVGRIQHLLMQRDRQHIRRVVESLLSAIPMVDIPIDYCNSVHQTLRSSFHDRQTNVVIDAKTTSSITLGMMTRWSTKDITIADITFQDRRYTSACCANCHTRYEFGARTNRRGIPSVTAARFA